MLAPRTKWRRVDEEAQYTELALDTRAAAYRQRAEERDTEYPGGTGMFPQSPGGSGSNKPAAISAMQGKQGEKRDRDMMATG